MKHSKLSVKLLPTFLGVIFALAFASFTFSTPATATGWCPDIGSTCSGGYCFTNGVGKSVCKYFQSSCSGGDCKKAPTTVGDEGPPANTGGEG